MALFEKIQRLLLTRALAAAAAAADAILAWRVSVTLESWRFDELFCRRKFGTTRLVLEELSS